MSYSSSVVLGSVVAMTVKLLACWLQMMIGRLFGMSNNIKYFIGLHTPLMRAFDHILRDPSFTLNKCGVLNGGPDWPVSVFCGLIGLNTCTVLFQTLPTILIVVPAVVC